MLANLALELGALPELRRICCSFNNRRKWKGRPALSLHAANPSVYLLGWREGDFTDIHDHGACEVGVYVVQGAVVEDLYATVEGSGKDRRCLLGFSRILRQGDMATCPRNYIHRVGNVFPEIAATLHVYGPALDDMNLYEEAGEVIRFKEHWHATHKAQH